MYHFFFSQLATFWILSQDKKLPLSAQNRFRGVAGLICSLSGYQFILSSFRLSILTRCIPPYIVQAGVHFWLNAVTLSISNLKALPSHSAYSRKSSKR